MNYGEKVKYVRKLKGKKSIELANYLKVSQAMVSKVETGISQFSPENTKLMAEFFKVPLEDLTLTNKAKQILHMFDLCGQG